MTSWIPDRHLGQRRLSLKACWDSARSGEAMPTFSASSWLHHIAEYLSSLHHNSGLLKLVTIPLSLLLCFTVHQLQEQFCASQLISINCQLSKMPHTGMKCRTSASLMPCVMEYSYPESETCNLAQRFSAQCRKGNVKRAGRVGSRCQIFSRLATRSPT